MRPFIRLFGIALIAASLTACESMSAGKDAKPVQGPVRSVQPVLTSQSAQPVLSEAAMQRTYNDLVKNRGNSSVQVFSLDDHDMSAPYRPDQSSAVPTPRLPQGVGQQFGSNAHVTVFSLDGHAPAYNAGAYNTGNIAAMSVGDAAGVYQDGVSRVYFNHGGKNVNAAGKETTSRIGQQCRSGGCGVVKVEGHASTRAEAKDEVQRRIINLKISMDRAMNVMRQLIRDGVPAGSIQVTAHGDRVPPVAIPSGDAESAARRVEIITGSAH